MKKQEIKISYHCVEKRLYVLHVGHTSYVHCSQIGKCMLVHKYPFLHIAIKMNVSTYTIQRHLSTHYIGLALGQHLSNNSELSCLQKIKNA